MILVTGGTGFIGSHVLEALRARGEPVRCLVRRRATLPPGVEPVQGDLVSGEGLEAALRGADTVIHLAGVTKALSREEYYAGNARGTRHLAQAIAKSGYDIRLVYVSSLAAIGPGSGRPTGFRGRRAASGHALWKVETGGRNDRAGAAAQGGDRAAGRGVRPPRYRRVPASSSRSAAGSRWKWRAGERWVQAIFVKDLAEGLLAAAGCAQAAGRAYFLAHAKALSWTELRQAAAGIMGKRRQGAANPSGVGVRGGRLLRNCGRG